MEKELNLSKEALDNIIKGNSEVFVFGDEKIVVSDSEDYDVSSKDDDGGNSSYLVSASGPNKRSASKADMVSLDSVISKTTNLDYKENGAWLDKNNVSIIIDKEEEEEVIPMIKRKKRKSTNILSLFKEEPQMLSMETIKNLTTTQNYFSSSMDESQIFLEDSLSRSRKKRIENLSLLKPVPTDTIKGINYDDNISFLSSLTNTAIQSKQEITTKVIKAPKKKENHEVLISKEESNPLVRRGVGDTLMFLQTLGCRPALFGEFVESKNVPIALTKEDGEEDIEDRKHLIDYNSIMIEHKDSYGNILTPKEAYKELSYKFHGKGPSASKLKKIAERRKERSIVNSTDLSTDQFPLFFKANNNAHTRFPNQLQQQEQLSRHNSLKHETTKKKSKIFGMQ